MNNAILNLINQITNSYQFDFFKLISEEHTKRKSVVIIEDLDDEDVQYRIEIKRIPKKRV